MLGCSVLKNISVACDVSLLYPGTRHLYRSLGYTGVSRGSLTPWLVKVKLLELPDHKVNVIR